MPSYAEVVTQTYLPAQAAKLRWESAKTVAGDQFNALAEQRRAIEEIRYRRQQYADNIAATDGSTDAFLFQALGGVVSAQPLDEKGRLEAERKAAKVVSDALALVKAQPGGSATYTKSSPEYLQVINAIKVSRFGEEYDAAVAAALAKDFPSGEIPLKPAKMKTKKQWDDEVNKGVAGAKQARDKAALGALAQFDLADNLGSRAFQGGIKGREFFESLKPDEVILARRYAAALLDDGDVTEAEIPEVQRAEARKLYEQIAANGAYRLQDKASFDKGYLEVLKNLAKDEARLKETEARLQGKTKETLAEELYTGATERAAIPPLLRSLEPEMKKYLDGFTEAQAADPKADPESFLRSKMTDREAKGFSAASAMAASGMRAADIMDNLKALSPEERRSVMGALASRDAIVSTQMKVAPGTPLPEIEKIQTEDRRAREAELARAETQLQRRLRQLDESLAESRKSGFGGIVSPDSGARPRRDVLMGALSPEEMDRLEQTPEGAEQLDLMLAKRSLRDVELGRQEVERIAAERDLARIEDVRRRDPDDPASELPSPVPPRLDPNRGNKTAGDEDRTERAQYEADLAADRAERARRTFGEMEDPRAAAVVRDVLMQGLEPARSVGPTRSDLRPEPFEFDKPVPAEPPAAPTTPEPVGFKDPTDPNSPTYFRADFGFKFTDKAGKEVNVPLNTKAGIALAMAEKGDVEAIKRLQAREAAKRKAAAPAGAARRVINLDEPDPTVDTTSDFIRINGKLQRNPNKK